MSRLGRDSSRYRARWASLALGAAVVLTSTTAGCSLGSSASGPSGLDPSAGVPGMLQTTLSSPAFPPGGPIPVPCAQTSVTGGKNLSVPLTWSGPPPEGTRSWGLAMVDTTAPGKGFVHWLVLDIPATVTSLPIGASGTGAMHGSAELRNDTGSYGYAGPSPPAGTHVYRLVLYALPFEKSGLGRGASTALFFQTVKEALGQTTLEGLFTR